MEEGEGEAAAGAHPRLLFLGGQKPFLCFSLPAGAFCFSGAEAFSLSNKSVKPFLLSCVTRSRTPWSLAGRVLLHLMPLSLRVSQKKVEEKEEEKKKEEKKGEKRQRVRTRVFAEIAKKKKPREWRDLLCLTIVTKRVLVLDRCSCSFPPPQGFCPSSCAASASGLAVRAAASRILCHTFKNALVLVLVESVFIS